MAGGHAQEQDVALCHINISGLSLAAHEFLDFVLQGLDQTGVDTSRVCFEVTESAAISNPANARRFIDSCSARGCKFALDDFGSGLSSFGYLKTLKVDII
ncbi:MAG: EAL domain-containing protein [Chromatiales bacterium]|nr:EAL domain-containing protein [Chromatiales bacterium]